MGQLPVQRGTQLFETAMQRAALLAALHVPLNVGCGHRVGFTVKIGLHAQGVRALHGALRWLVATSALSAPIVRAPAVTSRFPSASWSPRRSRDNACPRFPSRLRPRDSPRAVPL